MIDHYVALPSFCHCRGVTDWIYVRSVLLLLAFAYSRCGALVMSVIGICELNIEYDGKGCEYKYGGQRSYKRITTHSYVLMSFTQIDVDTIRWYYIMPLRMRTQSASQPIAESRGGGTGERVGRDRMGRGPRGDNDERVDKLNSQRNNQGLGANGGVEGVNGNGKGVNRGIRGALDFSMIIS
ncbi:hypothetical protein Tco_1074855 [Tanacetum coccineum]